ncbi:hypothetical protein QJQ45_027065, partial [Haematococcus lacustris]
VWLASLPGILSSMYSQSKVARAPCALCSSYFAWLQTNAIMDNDGSVYGRGLSRVTFTASAGVAYLVVVEGLGASSCGMPAITVSSSLATLPPLGKIDVMEALHGFFPCRPSRDYTYRLPAFSATRSITIDTCMPGASSWDTFLFVVPEQSGACSTCPTPRFSDDNQSVCGRGLSRVTFTATAGVAYLVVVEGWSVSNVSVLYIMSSMCVSFPSNTRTSWRHRTRAVSCGVPAITISW